MSREDKVMIKKVVNVLIGTLFFAVIAAIVLATSLAPNNWAPLFVIINGIEY